MTTTRRWSTPIRASSRAVHCEGTITVRARATAARLTGMMPQRATGWVVGLRITVVNRDHVRQTADQGCRGIREVDEPRSERARIALRRELHPGVISALAERPSGQSRIERHECARLIADADQPERER